MEVLQRVRAGLRCSMLSLCSQVLTVLDVLTGIIKGDEFGQRDL